MTKQERMELALEILEDQDIIEIFEDSLFIKVDRFAWEDLFGKVLEEEEEIEE